MQKFKVVLTGAPGVGKTSLFNRFLYNRFSESYQSTIGVKVDKKIIEQEHEEIVLMIWDVAGEASQDKIPSSYFLGAHAIVYVIDLSQPIIRDTIQKNISILEERLPGCLIHIVGNKADIQLENNQELLEVLKKEYATMQTSAKTGFQVEALFVSLAQQLQDIPRNA